MKIGLLLLALITGVPAGLNALDSAMTTMQTHRQQQVDQVNQILAQR